MKKKNKPEIKNSEDARKILEFKLRTYSINAPYIVQQKGNNELGNIFPVVDANFINLQHFQDRRNVCTYVPRKTFI